MSKKLLQIVASVFLVVLTLVVICAGWVLVRSYRDSMAYRAVFLLSAVRAARNWGLIPQEKEKEVDLLEAKYLQRVEKRFPLLATILPELGKRTGAIRGLLQSSKVLRQLQQAQRSERKNLEKLRSAVAAYHRDNGVYPPCLCEEDLVPKYIDEIPGDDWTYDSATGKVSSKFHPEW